MNDLVNIDAELAKEVSNLQDRIQRPAANAIRTTQDKKFKLPDGSLTEGPIDVIIVDFINQNQYYEGRYDANNITPPTCYAIDKITKNMKPGKNAAKPQSSECSNCPLNEFGSEGTGKACKNTIVMAILPPDATPETEMMTLRVSPTGLKNFNAYVATVSKLFGAPPIKVITEISFNPSKTYPSLQFAKPRANSQYGTHFARRTEAEIMLTSEPDAPTSTPTAAEPKAKGKTSRDAVRDSRA